MADLKIHGKVATVKLDRDPLDGDVTAHCEMGHGKRLGCGWQETYDDLGDAVEYAADHADRGTP